MGRPISWSKRSMLLTLLLILHYWFCGCWITLLIWFCVYWFCWKVGAFKVLGPLITNLGWLALIGLVSTTPSLVRFLFLDQNLFLSPELVRLLSFFTLISPLAIRAPSMSIPFLTSFTIVLGPFNLSSYIISGINFWINKLTCCSSQMSREHWLTRPHHICKKLINGSASFWFVLHKS